MAVTYYTLDCLVDMLLYYACILGYICYSLYCHVHMVLHALLCVCVCVMCVCVMTRAHDDKSWSLSSLKTISAVSTSCVFRKVDQHFI